MGWETWNDVLHIVGSPLFTFTFVHYYRMSGILLNKNALFFPGVARQSEWQSWINSSFAGWKKLKAESPKGKTERVTLYISAFIYVHLITVCACLHFPGDLTVILLNLQSAELSISRNQGLESITKIADNFRNSNKSLREIIYRRGRACLLGESPAQRLA